MESDINGTLEGGNIQEYCNLGKKFDNINPKLIVLNVYSSSKWFKLAEVIDMCHVVESSFLSKFQIIW